jgi:hypothetical protein
MGGGGRRSAPSFDWNAYNRQQEQQRQQQQQAQMQAMIAAQQAAAAAAAAAEKKRVDTINYQGAFNSAQTQGQQGAATAQQQIEGLNAEQKATDLRAVAPVALTNVGGGAGYSIGNAKRAALGAVGASGGTTGVGPSPILNSVADTALNGAGKAAAAVAAMAQQNKANVTGSGANQFTLPTTDGIKFGGQ